MILGVKSTFEGAVRRFNLTLNEDDTPSASSIAEFRELCACVSRVYTISNFRLQYRDDDYDLIPITSDIELRHAAHYVERTDSGGVLRLLVAPLPDSNPDPETEPEPEPEPELEPTEILSEPQATKGSVKKAGEKKAGTNKLGASKDGAKAAKRGGKSGAKGIGKNKRGKQAVSPDTYEEPGSETDIVEIPIDTRFDVHEGIECTRCIADPITGVRHWCVSRPAVNLCDSCRENAGAELDALAWRRIPYPWLADDATRTVPQAPLQLGDGSAQVKFLQKLLIDLGYLPIGHVDKLVGWFQGHTAQAVANFRAAYGIEAESDAADYVYDDSVAAILAYAVTQASIA